ncbi:hypothetical protein ON010_g2241 [Phytophthora cinnamomi]|nr:hypothetical protein ON010_g2241 [Phytophthora cinnamomi]
MIDLVQKRTRCTAGLASVSLGPYGSRPASFDPAEMRAFFGQPLAGKRKVLANESMRGYTPLHEETLDPAVQTRGDTKEGYYICRHVPPDSADMQLPLHGPNVFPDASAFPTFRATMETYHAAMCALGFGVAQLFAEAAGHKAASTARACSTSPWRRCGCCTTRPRSRTWPGASLAPALTRTTASSRCCPRTRRAAADPPRRPVGRRAVARGRLRGQHRRHGRAVHERPLPVHAAPRGQSVGPGALLSALLLRAQLHVRGRVLPELRERREPGQVPAHDHGQHPCIGHGRTAAVGDAVGEDGEGPAVVPPLPAVQ